MKLNKKQKYCLEVCKSKCCNWLAIKWSPRQLEKMYDNWYKQKKGEKMGEDIFLIYPMLQFIEKKKDKKAKLKYAYRCKMLINGKCSIYKHRPRMCSRFGVEYPVDYGENCIYGKDFKLEKFIRPKPNEGKPIPKS